MPKQPKMGPDWFRLWTITAKLAEHKPLDRSDEAWLVELLCEAAAGEDVSQRLTENRKQRIREDRDFWIACDVAWHVHHHRNAHETVVDRWPGLSVDNLKKIVAKRRTDTDAIAHLLGCQFVRVIDWHRKKNTKGT